MCGSTEPFGDEEVDFPCSCKSCSCKRVVYFHKSCYSIFQKNVQDDRCFVCGKWNTWNKWNYLLSGLVVVPVVYSLGSTVRPDYGLIGRCLVGIGVAGIGGITVVASVFGYFTYKMMSSDDRPDE
jgi:hypothetical protein